ncbi:MAG: hypothetical protein CL920_10685 [Deltaproteobacteria bacterium]|nr:hypothetical protein [Deltaproteobacteria bacterium]MBU49152.1 hypothetical protein [Deltaproteobacteria bacterium]|tara:strand:- start:87 stop:665 length:579 start_codon:yes stop_codon:yes gene_type:complete
MPELTVFLKERMLGKFPITKTEMLIGRDATNDIPIDNTGVSRYHARVIYQDQRYYCMDEFSSNGTYVNGMQIKEHPLEDGDVIQIAKYHIAFSLADTTPHAVGNMAPQLSSATESTTLFSLNEMNQLLTEEKQAEATGLHSRMAGFEHEQSELEKQQKQKGGSKGKTFLITFIAFIVFVAAFLFIFQYLTPK